MRRHVPALAVLFSLLVATSVAVAHPEGSGYNHVGTHRVGLPDLKADPADQLVLQQSSSGASSKLLLRFSGYIYNSRTAGTLELHGTGRTDTTMGDVQQRVYTGTGSTWTELDAAGATLAYESGDGHEHWHLNSAASYALVGPADSASSDEVFAPNLKVGFCAIDSEGDHAPWIDRGSYFSPQWAWQDTPTSSGHGNCGDRDPAASQTVMGLTPGWRDKYGWTLWNQWVDVSNVQPGSYRIRNVVDPLDYVAETDETNAPAYTAVNVPGYLAEPVTAVGLSPISPSTIELGTDYVASPLDPVVEAPKFRIVDGPAHGTLSVPTGEWLSLDAEHPRVTYTPGTDGTDADSFTYQVREGDSAFPTSPSEATVAIALAAPTPPAEQVLVSGGGGSLITGTSRELAAEVTNARGAGTVTWRVEGVQSGNPTVGTIDASGLYTAPATVPADDTVDVSATSDRGATATTTIQITAPPVPEPEPTTEPVDPPGSGDGEGGDDDGRPGRGENVSGGVVTSVTPPGPPSGGSDPTPPPGGSATHLPAKTVPISGLKVVRDGRYVVASFLPGRSGKARTELLKGKKRVGACSARITAGRRYTCRIVLRGKTRTKKLKVRVLARRSNGRGLVVRSARVRAARATARHRHR